MNTVIRHFKYGVTIALILGLSQVAVGASDVVKIVNNQNSASTAAALTEADFAFAKPLQLIASPSQATALSAQAISTGAKASSNSSGPTVKVTADNAAKLFNPTFYPALDPALDLPIPADRGSSGANYTLSSMIPNTQSNANTYPHITTGKLYFSLPGGTGYCTASVINRRIVVTAGHCVSDGLGHFYSNFQFVPATWNGSAPYQIWTWAAAWTTSTWHFGGGGVPNAADYAMIEFNDRVFSGVTRRIGTVTGWLGWQTGSCGSNHTHKLGYPSNVFGGTRLSLASSQTWRNVAPLNCEYGTPQTFGASGGPWIQNFALSNPIPQNNSGLLRVVAVASYTYGQTFGVLGASNPDSRFVSVWNAACAHRSGNCS
jgi:V8-like Glu-specific endopeptidase